MIVTRFLTNLELTNQHIVLHNQLFDIKLVKRDWKWEIILWVKTAKS